MIWMGGGSSPSRQNFTMVDWSRIPHLEWALQFNQDMRQMLESTFEQSHGYWAYLDELVGFLRSKNVGAVREKIADANHLDKFYSTVSELEFARVLASKGKKVTLLADDFFENRTSPDMLVADSSREGYVEVKRLTEGRASYMIADFLRSYLNHPGRRYRVDINLNEELSIPVTQREEREAREKVAQRVIERFPSVFGAADLTSLPASFEINGVRFEVHPTRKLQRGYPGIIQTPVIEVPTEKWAEKLAEDICEKAKKRQAWTGEDLRKHYIVAVDCEQKYLDEDDVDLSLIGSTVTHWGNIPLPKIKLGADVQHAIMRGWKTFLEKKCVVPSGTTYLDPAKKGVLMTEPVTRNVSAVITRFANGTVYLLPNPFAFDEINDVGIQAYLE
jgi:hypothetical protein